MQIKKIVGLVEARATLSGLTKAVKRDGGAIAITQRSRLAAVLVNAERYEADMTELAHYRRQRRKKFAVPFSRLMEITGDLEEGSQHFAEEYYAAVERSGKALSDALRD